MANSPRKYNKKADYWKKFHAGQSAVMPAQQVAQEKAQDSAQGGIPTLEFEGIDTPFMQAEGSCGGSGSSDTRAGFSTTDVGLFQSTNYENLRSGFLPYYYSNGFVNINDTVELCQRAYANVSIFKNTIDVMTEFSNSKLHLRGGNEASKNFFYAWFQKIGLNAFKEEFFREYYRSGNVFIYKFDGKFGKDDYIKLQKLGSTSEKIPLRYTIVNPATIAIYGAMGYNFNYVRLLSPYEIARLRNQQTDEDKAVFKSLPVAIQKQISQQSTVWKEMYIPLDPDKLFSVFYKKQSYEPFAVPMGFPVLNDIEWKLQLKKMDMALTRTIENVILLITMGAEKDKGGINTKNIESMKVLLQNRAVGRVIVSDYTTKAQFIVPAIADIIGEDKYKVVNQDIQEGLQNILLGSEKFANQFIKTKVFLERLSEGQDAFKNWLVPQMQKVAESMGFRDCPEPVFEQIDLKDEIQFGKLIASLGTMGILTAEQVIATLESGLYPEIESMVPDQQKYKADRDKGLFFPLVGGSDTGDGATGRPNGAKAPQTQKRVGPIGKGKASDDTYDSKLIGEFYSRATELENYTGKLLKKKHKVKKLNEVQLGLATQLARNVISRANLTDWENAVGAFINDGKIEFTNKELTEEIDRVSQTFEVEQYEAAAMVHSKNLKNKD